MAGEIPRIIAGMSGADMEAALVKSHNLVVLKDNLIATANPVVDNDSSQGYAVDSSWVNVAADEKFVCLDETIGAAVWKSVTSGSSTGTPLAQDLSSPNSTDALSTAGVAAVLASKSDSGHNHNGAYATPLQGAKADSALQDITGEVAAQLSDIPAPEAGKILQRNAGNTAYVNVDIPAGSGGVSSIDGEVGAVTLADISLDQVNNTSDVNKPISTAQDLVNAAQAATNLTKETKLDTSNYPATGAGNTFGLSDQDTLQTAVDKLEAYIAAVSGGGGAGVTAKNITLATSANLAALQGLEPSVTVNDLVFEWDDGIDLIYTVVPLDNLADVPVQDLSTVSPTDTLSTSGIAAELGNISLTAAEIAPYPGMTLVKGQGYIDRVDYDLLVASSNVPSFPMFIVEDTGVQAPLATHNFADFNGVDGQITLPKTYSLASDGDYVEIVSKLNAANGPATLGLAGESGGTDNILGYGNSSDQFVVRNNGGAYLFISIPTIDQFTWNLFRVTQTDATTWTVTINGIIAGTIPRSDVLNINSIAAAYSTSFVDCSVKSIKISTAVTGSLELSDIVKEVTDKNIVNSGITNVPVAYKTTDIIIHGNANNKIEIYVPQTKSGKFIKYSYVNDVNPANASDVFKIKSIASVDAFQAPFIFNNQKLITAVGAEIETAIRVQGDTDFFGGVQHGRDEKTSIAMLIDGVTVDITTLTFSTAKVIQINQTSENYVKVGADFRAINCATSDREWNFKLAGFNFKNKITWKTSQTLLASYMAMLPMLRLDNGRQVTEFGSWEGSPPVDISQDGGFIQTITTSPNTKTWGDLERIYAEVNVLSGWDKPNKQSYISDSVQYNKSYFDFTGTGYVTSIAEVFDAETEYLLKLEA